MVPVVNGKYKVWTKKLGSGPIKALAEILQMRQVGVRPPNRTDSDFAREH
jgi:hypothetical protein